MTLFFKLAVIKLNSYVNEGASCNYTTKRFLTFLDPWSKTNDQKEELEADSEDDDATKSIQNIHGIIKDVSKM